MREIKLRQWTTGWSSGKDRMIYLGDISDEEFSPLTQGTFLEFTGLTDKNNVEIYEGDILKLILIDYADVPEDQFVVSGDTFHADVCYLESIITHISETDSENDSVEVIGNIYENPSLLEE